MFCPHIICLAFVWVLLTVSGLAQTDPFQGQRVLWLGDSITQMGGYVSMTDYYLERWFPHDQIDIVSIGLASETTSGLSEKTHPFPRPCVHERLARALELVKPTLVVACYGMNDGVYAPSSPERFKAFQDGITKLVTAVQNAHAKLILLTPTPFESFKLKCVPETAPDFGFSAPYEKYDDVLAEFAKWELTLASKDITVIDLHTPISQYLAAQQAQDPKFGLTRDGIHPQELGALLMSKVIVESLTGKKLSDNIQSELSSIRTDPLYRAVTAQRRARSDGWLAYVGYTRGKTVKSDDITKTEADFTAAQLKIDKIRNPSGP